MTVWNGARLVGLLPLMLSREKRYGLSVRRLGALANDHSPRVDLLLAPDVKGVMEAIWRHIVATRREWDIFELPRLLSKSPTLECLSEQADADGIRFGLWQAEVSPFIDLRTNWNRYLADRSKGFRRDIRRKRWRLKHLGHSALEIVADPYEMPAALEAACAIEADGWKGQRGSAMQSIANVLQFYKQMVEGMSKRGMLRLHFLTLDGERIAFDLSIEVGKSIYSLKSGFRDAQAAASPGLMLLYLIVQHYMAHGKQEIDLLGEEDHFKRHWTRTARSHHWFISCSGSLRGRIIRLIKFGIVPGLKKIRARLTST
ncbi:MAG: GNAT family N-acetyltransferase [Xanthomonadaceae bacterium]|nr:GNAT family N-acetyltransferase [Xanthomonadaceae bacterium]